MRKLQHLDLKSRWRGKCQEFERLKDLEEECWFVSNQGRSLQQRTMQSLLVIEMQMLMEFPRNLWRFVLLRFQAEEGYRKFEEQDQGHQ